MLLRNRLLIAFMIMIFVSLAITGVVTTFRVNNEFDAYLVKEHERKLENIKNLGIKALQTTEEVDLGELSIYAVSENYIIEIHNEYGDIIFETSNKLKFGMMGGDMSLSQMQNIPMYKNLVIENEIVKTSDGKIYLLQVGFMADFALSKEAGSFKSALYKSIALSVLLSSIIGLLLSAYFSKPLSASIISASVAAESISKGHLKTRLSKEGNIIEINRLQVSMNNMAELLEEQEQLRKSIVDKISHEVKTPLTVLKSHLEAFTDGVFKPDKERFQNCYDEILRLEDMLNRIEHVHELDSNNLVLSLTSFDMSKEIENVCQILKPQFGKKKINLLCESERSVIVELDHYKVRQILYNLLSNAFKFSKVASTVEIKLNDISDNEIEIEIINSGKKINVEDWNRIFESQFRSIGSDDYDPQGKGFGLSITKELVEFMNGNIKVIKSDDKETIFRLNLFKQI